MRNVPLVLRLSNIYRCVPLQFTSVTGVHVPVSDCYHCVVYGYKGQAATYSQHDLTCQWRTQRCTLTTPRFLSVWSQCLGLNATPPPPTIVLFCMFILFSCMLQLISDNHVRWILGATISWCGPCLDTPLPDLYNTFSISASAAFLPALTPNDSKHDKY